MTNRNDILEKLKHLNPLSRQNYHAEIKGIFGSFSRDEMKTGSDIDVMVEFQDNASLLDLCALGNFLENTFKCKVDIVSEESIRKEIRNSIYQDLIKI